MVLPNEWPSLARNRLDLPRTRPWLN